MGDATVIRFPSDRPARSAYVVGQTTSGRKQHAVRRDETTAACGQPVPASMKLPTLRFNPDDPYSCRVCSDRLTPDPDPEETS